MINKLISSLYISYFSKSDFTHGLLDFVYDEFSQRFGFKKVIDKKFIEFISSMIAYEDSRRCKVFLRFIGSGISIKKIDFSDESLKLYLSSFNFMVNSKIGIAPFDDTLDKIMLPFSRAIECIKDRFDQIDRNLATKIISLLEKKTAVDPKRINPLGMIENELLLETLVENFEDLRNNSKSEI